MADDSFRPKTRQSQSWISLDPPEQPSTTETRGELLPDPRDVDEILEEAEAAETDPESDGDSTPPRRGRSRSPRPYTRGTEEQPAPAPAAAAAPAPAPADVSFAEGALISRDIRTYVLKIV